MNRGRVTVTILLATATAWAVGNLIVGGLVAPAVFSLAPPHGDAVSRVIAGHTVGLVLERWSFTALLLWVAVLACLVRLTVLQIGVGRRGWLIGLMVTAAVILAVRPIGHAAVVNGGQLAAELRRDSPPDNDPRRAQFRALHGRSMAVGAIETLLITSLALAAGIALSRASVRP